MQCQQELRWGMVEYGRSLNPDRLTAADLRQGGVPRDTVNPQAWGLVEQLLKTPTTVFPRQDKPFLVPSCHLREEKEEGQNLKDPGLSLKETIINCKKMA